MFIGLLLLSLNAAAQQVADSHAPNQPASTTQAAQPQPATTTAAQSAPVTMDQVVDRFLEREHSLIKMLESRTPIVETYLQNLTLDPQLGPVPKDDRYFLGRMDLSESIDRKDYLKDSSMEKHLLGDFTNLFKIQYRPLGFSWMIFADRSDFDRAHYDFRYVRREFLGDVRCLVFDVTPK
jgi:hypothetical protein